MENSHKPLRAYQPRALSNQKQVEEVNKIKNTAIEEEILNGLQTKDHFLRPSTLDIIHKRSTQKKRVSSERPENTQSKCIKLSDEIENKSICTMSKKEEGLLGKVKLMIGEQMNILNDSFDQKVQSLNRRLEEIQCKRNHEERAKTFLKKISKLEGHINAMIVFQKEMNPKMSVPQIMVPCTNYQIGVLNQPGPSAFYPGIINIPMSSNTLFVSSNIGLTSQHVSQHVRITDEVLMVSMENQPSTITISSELLIEQTEFKLSAPRLRLPKAERRNITEVLSGAQTFKQFPHLPPLPRIPLCPELPEEFKDTPQNPQTRSGLCAKSKGIALTLTHRN